MCNFYKKNSEKLHLHFSQRIFKLAWKSCETVAVIEVGGGHFVPSPLFRKCGLPVLEPSRIIILSIALGLCLLFRGSLGATWANGKNTFWHDIGHSHRGGKYFIRYMGPSSRSYSCGTIMTSPLLSAYRDWHTSRTCNRIWQEYMHFVVPEKII